MSVMVFFFSLLCLLLQNEEKSQSEVSSSPPCCFLCPFIFWVQTCWDIGGFSQSHMWLPTGSHSSLNTRVHLRPCSFPKCISAPMFAAALFVRMCAHECVWQYRAGACVFSCGRFWCHASLRPQIRKLRRELDASQEKVSALTTQLSANVRTNTRNTHAPVHYPFQVEMGLRRDVCASQNVSTYLSALYC